MLRGRRAKYTRVGFLMRTQSDPSVEHGIDVEIMTVELALQPDRSAHTHAANQASNPIAQNVGALQCLFHETRVTGPRVNLPYRRPFRAFDAVRAIPFGIFRNHNAALVRCDRPRATEPAFVLKHIGPKGGLIRIVPLLNAYRIDGKIERFARRRRAEVPQTHAVVTVDRLGPIR